MALPINELKQLMLATAKASQAPAANFSFAGKELSAYDLNETLRAELNELAGDHNAYRRNKLDVFELIEETVDELLPNRIRNTYEMFAETRTFAQGDKPVFTRKMGKARARQFVSRVGLAGLYEVFKLDKQSFTVETTAFGGAAQIGFEEFLDGRVDFAELTEVVMQGLEDAVYAEVTKALMGALTQLPEANRHAAAGFSATEFDKLLNIARLDGEVTILTSLELASKLVMPNQWISDADKTDVRNQGYVGMYKGARVAILPQYYLDLANTKLGVDPSFAWLLPAGSLNEKPIKIAFEGQTIVDEYTNYDRSREIQVYKKFGVTALMTNNICVYQDTSLAFPEHSSVLNGAQVIK